MKKIMLIAGGSDPAGSEIDGSEDSQYNREHAFGNLLAKKLGYEPVNIAQNGATNPTIARSVLEWFKKNYDANTMEVFVLVGWSESVRMEVPVDWPTWYEESNPAADWFSETSRDYLRINMGWKGSLEKEIPIIAYHQEFMARNTTFLEIVSANLILQLQYFFKTMNVEYLMCNTLHMFTRDKHTEFYMSKIDQTKYINFDNNNECFYWKYKNEGHENPKAKYWHHGEEPHRLYSEKLYEFVIKNYNVK